MTVKLICQAEHAHGEMIAALIAETMHEATAVSLAEAPGGWRIEAYFAEAPDLAPLNAILADVLPENATPALWVEAVPDEDWVSIVQRGLPAVRAGRFLVYGSHERHAARSRAFAIEIDAGRAFGTAHHGTTTGCLLAISDLAKSGARVSHALDVGTGSGVLAIAVAKALGARVTAADIDPVAVSVARDNCRINGVSGRVTTICARRLSYPDIARRAPFDLIVANILAGPLVLFAASMRCAMRAGGVLVLSGLLDGQAAEVWGRYRSVGFRLIRRSSIEGWTTLMLARS